MVGEPDDARLSEVIGPYELRERVRAGDMSETFRAFDRAGDRWVMLTRLRPEVALRGDAMKQFTHDADTLVALDHPGLLPVSRGEDDLGVPFTVREDVVGETLASLLERQPGGLPMPVAMSIAEPLAGALLIAHGRGLAHGHPGAPYVLLTEDAGRRAPVLIGFGMSDGSAMLGVAPERALTLPPELLMGGEPDPTSDIYAFGALVYEMIAGEPPASEGAALQAAVDDVPASLSRMVQRTLSSVRERRPSIDEVHQVLRDLAPRQSEFPAPSKLSSISQSLRAPWLPAEGAGRRAPAAGTVDRLGDSVAPPAEAAKSDPSAEADPAPATPVNRSPRGGHDQSFADILGESELPPAIAASDSVDPFADMLDELGADGSTPPPALQDGDGAPPTDTASTGAAVQTSLMPAASGPVHGSLPPPSAWSEELESIPPALRGVSAGPPAGSAGSPAESAGSHADPAGGPQTLSFNLPADPIGAGGSATLALGTAATAIEEAEQGGEFTIPTPADPLEADPWGESVSDTPVGGEFTIPPPVQQQTALPIERSSRFATAGEDETEGRYSANPPPILPSSVPALPGSVPPLPVAGAVPPPPPASASMAPRLPPAARSVPPSLPHIPPVAPKPAMGRAAGATVRGPGPGRGSRPVNPPQLSVPPPTPPAALRPASKAADIPVDPAERADDIEEALAAGTLGGGSWGDNAAAPAAPNPDSSSVPSKREEPDEETLARRKERRRRRRPTGEAEGLPGIIASGLTAWVLLAAILSPMVFAHDVSLVRDFSGIDGRVIAVFSIALGGFLLGRLGRGARSSRSRLLMAAAVLMAIALGGLGLLTLELFMPPDSLGPLTPLSRLAGSWGLSLTLVVLCVFAVGQVASPRVDLSFQVACLLGLLALECLFGTAWIVSRSLRVADGESIRELYYAPAVQGPRP